MTSISSSVVHESVAQFAQLRLCLNQIQIVFMPVRIIRRFLWVEFGGIWWCDCNIKAVLPG
ncbi:uncharacterized protein J3R85_001394 [Psidium guajava]|nr:uncharacterized protein J3R85_001394 [Psidium guajava]